jgi:hopanoid biosynthesis associated protein HpnK
VRRLIINADDFGLTPGVNHAIAEAHQNGIVTSTTLMANSKAFAGAIETARSVGPDDKFSVGCHVVLMDGEPLLPAKKVPTLLDPANGGHRFRDSLNDFVVASFRHKLNPEEIEAEASAQLDRIRDAGVTPSHFDTHKHAHMFPAVLRPLLRAARARGVKAVRNPFGQVWPLPLASLLRTRQVWKRFAQLNVLRNFARSFRRDVEAHGLKTTDGSLGVLATGVLDLELFTSMIESMPEGTWEFVCHPGYSDADLDQVRTRLRHAREQELSLLTSPEAKELLRRRGVELISYHEL